MLLKVFAVYDVDQEAFGQPFYMLTQAEARRALITSAHTEDHLFKLYPHQFQLFQIGEWDNNTGEFNKEMSPQNLGSIAANTVGENNVQELYPENEGDLGVAK